MLLCPASIFDNSPLQWVQDFIGDVDIPKYLTQTTSEFFFTKVRKRTLSTITSAVVIDVPPLLDFSRNRTIVISALK
jgi:hypothetical protein